MNKPDSVILMPCNDLTSFYKKWFELLRPFHHLTDREIDVAAAFVRQRYELSKKISDPDLLDQVLWSEQSRKEIRESCNMTQAHFQMVVSSLRKCRMIIDNRINPRYIPNLTGDDNDFSLLIYFKRT